MYKNKHRGIDHNLNFKIIIIIITLTYIFGFIIGIYVSGNNNQINPLASNPSLNFYHIFMNNLLVTILIIFSGLISCGLFPLIFTFREAYLLSNSLVKLAVISDNSFIKLFLLGVLPHGILEIPALVLSSSLGLFFGIKLLTTKNSLKEELYYLMETYHYNIAPLLLIAGMIEVSVTPFLILNFM